MKKLTTLLLAFVMVFSLAACGEEKPADQQTDASNEEQVVEKALIVGSPDFTGDFYEGWTNSSYDKAIRRLVFTYGLLEDTKDGQLVDSPLVEKKEVSDDQLTWTFTLKDGLTFQNGEELTVSDVKFTYDFYMDKEALQETGGSSSLDEFIEEVTIDEEARTVSFKFKQAMYAMDMLGFYEIYILPEDTIKKGAEEASQTVQAWVKAHVSEPIGYGAYEVVEFKPSEFVKLKAFDGYAGTKPAIKEIIVKVVPTETDLDQLMQGEVDMLTGQVESEKIDAVKASGDTLATNNYFRHGGGAVYLHCDFGPFKLTEVRQAFAYVFNRPKVIELFLGEYGVASQGPYSKNNWMMYDDDEKDLQGTAAVGKFEASLTNYDILDADGNFDEAANIAKAHELLDAAAAKTDGDYAMLTGNAKDGYMWDGKPLELKLTYDPFWSDTYNLTWPADYIEKLGFKITLIPLDWAVEYAHWSGETEEERQYNAFVGGNAYLIKENPKNDYGVDKLQEWGKASPNNIRFTGGSSFTPEEWDQLLTDIQNCDPVNGKDQYRDLWRQYIVAMNKEVPMIPVYSNNYHDFYVNTLENFNTNALWPWERAVLEANWKAAE